LAALRAPDRFSGLLALGVIHPFQRPTPAKALQAWCGMYQLFLAAPWPPRSRCGRHRGWSPPRSRAATVRGDANSDAEHRLYGEVFQDPARARATARLSRTFLLRELPYLQRYQTQRLAVPTRLLIGDGDPIGSPVMLAEWESHAHDMAVEVVPSAGHFLAEEAPGEVAAAVDTLFGSPTAPPKQRLRVGSPDEVRSLPNP